MSHLAVEQTGLRWELAMEAVVVQAQLILELVVSFGMRLISYLRRTLLRPLLKAKKQFCFNEAELKFYYLLNITTLQPSYVCMYIVLICKYKTYLLLNILSKHNLDLNKLRHVQPIRTTFMCQMVLKLYNMNLCIVQLYYGLFCKQRFQFFLFSYLPKKITKFRNSMCL